jgi:hypothetical protein
MTELWFVISNDTINYNWKDMFLYQVLRMDFIRSAKEFAFFKSNIYCKIGVFNKVFYTPIIETINIQQQTQLVKFAENYRANFVNNFEVTTFEPNLIVFNKNLLKAIEQPIFREQWKNKIKNTHNGHDYPQPEEVYEQTKDYTLEKFKRDAALTMLNTEILIYDENKSTIIV